MPQTTGEPSSTAGWGAVGLWPQEASTGQTRKSCLPQWQLALTNDRAPFSPLLQRDGVPEKHLTDFPTHIFPSTASYFPTFFFLIMYWFYPHKPHSMFWMGQGINKIQQSFAVCQCSLSVRPLSSRHTFSFTPWSAPESGWSVVPEATTSHVTPSPHTGSLELTSHAKYKAFVSWNVSSEPWKCQESARITRPWYRQHWALYLVLCALDECLELTQLTIIKL